MFNSKTDPFTQVVLGDQKPMPVADHCDSSTCSSDNGKVDPPDTNLAYVFFRNSEGTFPLSLAIDRAGVQKFLTLDGSNYGVTAPFLLLGIDELPEPNKIFGKTIETNTANSFVGTGSIFADATHFDLLQAGFSHEGSGTSETVKRNLDNFLLVEVRPGKTVDGKPVLDPDRTERYLFATGDVDGGRLLDGQPNPNFKSEFSVDRYFISPGLEGFGEGFTTAGTPTGKTVASSIRAFSRKETGLGLNLADTGLLVVNPSPESSATQSTLLHADFGLQGERSAQQSTISVTIGNVDYQIKTCETCDTKQSVEAVVAGHTIGSSHGTIKQANQNGTTTVVNGATVGFSSPIRSTAAGGGNPALNREGYAGYFVLENYDPAKDPQDPNSKTENGDTPLPGGTEKPLGGSGSDQNYAYLRLATATGSSKPTLHELTLNGWMGGLAEFQNGSGGIGLTQIDSGDTPDKVTIQTSPTNNTVVATFSLQGQIEGTFTPPFNLGGLNVDGTSAFVDDNRFAARSNNSGYEVAMVTADLFRDSNGNLPAALNRPDGTTIPQYEHLKWGFFFGDTKNTPGAREHVNLGTWIAGKIPTGDSLGLRGTASYSGHSIGNVFTNGSLYTAVGSFNNQWDFDKRTGTVQMNFDNTNYDGTTAIKGSTFNFGGNLTAPGRQGGLQGSFVAPVNPTPAAVMGNFAIAETPGNTTTYRAAGTFGAEKPK